MVLFQGQKRIREEEEDDYAQEHMDKRFRNASDDFEFRTTPFGTFPLPYDGPKPTYTKTMDSFPTPISENGDNAYGLAAHWNLDERCQQTEDVDMDSDDEDGEHALMTPPPSFKPTAPTFARPARPARLDSNKFTNPSALGGRLPTPILNNFNGPISRQRNVPAALSLNTAHTRFLASHEHWIASPISEDEPTTPNCSAEALMSQLNVVSGDRMDSECSSPLTPARKGRLRSGAIVAPKGHLSMGYREDCEKCRARIPGHYSHFIPG